ncbi:glycosyltransferase family 4 protein (plasmid) [Thalassobaculum sp. OXR-137]|uniref:glycosyltransferase family 4 protein n=1 Tax=Thalassobaculum sp. OXR-137 TaxID=3100173 RepID=UPI002AC89DCA|nr:glycosyltransferase family 4 protein [Thalassobaculum sp. OXR-137]WPZ37240.1 glycosyltransferase family 4 protein [Thalassobaculum sp. OXR-137]
MRIAVSTIGRFHSFDLACQLAARNMLAVVYTGYPRFKLANTGVAAEAVRTFPWVQTPYMALMRYGWFQRWLDVPWARVARRTFDAHVARSLVDCDLVSILSGFGMRTGEAARQRGIRVVCDRGSSHILTQDALLREEYDRVGLRWRGIDPDVIDRELAEYETADAISVPSTFVRDSFLRHGVAPDKMLFAPYGVDLRGYQRACPRDREFRVLFVGGLSVRKGLHDLLAAFRLADLKDARLVLVGSATPETTTLLGGSVPEDVELTGHLSRDGVIREMSRASVMVLPSVEEGLALVMAQALSCGCPVIASTHTGAEDLFCDDREGFVVPIRDPDAIADRLTRLHEDRDLLARMSDAAAARVGAIGGWQDYGDRIERGYRAIVDGGSPAVPVRSSAQNSRSI